MLEQTFLLKSHDPRAMMRVIFFIGFVWHFSTAKFADSADEGGNLAGGGSRRLWTRENWDFMIDTKSRGPSLSGEANGLLHA